MSDSVTPARTTKVTIGDVLGGIAASAVGLPQAMAFGVALFALMHLNAASGALAGLIGATVLCTVSGLAGGTYGLITAPSGPVLILLSGAIASVLGTGAEIVSLPYALMAILMLAGVFQFLIGISGGGQLIKYIPHPVVAGFLTGSGLLMVISQIGTLKGKGTNELWASWIWLPFVIAATTYLIMTVVPKRFPKVPSTIAGLVGGTIVFQIMIQFGPGEVPAAWVIGTIPGLADINFNFQLSHFTELPWTIIVSSALALALLASLDTLFTCVIADVETGVRHDSRRELIAQGAGQFLTGLLGGMGGSGTTGATVVSVKTGGRRWSALFAGLTFLTLIIFAGPAGKVFPICVLGGIIVHVGISMLEWDIVSWLKRHRTRKEAIIALVVTVVTVGYDLMAAIGVGVAIAIFLFIKEQVAAPVVHLRSDATQRRSVRSRPQSERDLLDRYGNRIVIYELRGNLFFATADKLFNELGADLEQPNWVILHMRRVSQVDFTGIKILNQIAERLHANGGQLIFCSVHKATGLGHKVKKTLRKLSTKQGVAKVKTMNGSDEALEYAENDLLQVLGVEPVHAQETVPFAKNNMCKTLTEEEIEILQGLMVPVSLKKKEFLFKTGEMGDELYAVLSGGIDIQLPTTEHHYKRLATYGPGTFFGVIAFVDPGPRAAGAVAVQDTELLMLDREVANQLGEESSKLMIHVMFTLSSAQSEYLRWSVTELRRMSQW